MKIQRGNIQLPISREVLVLFENETLLTYG